MLACQKKIAAPLEKNVINIYNAKKKQKLESANKPNDENSNINSKNMAKKFETNQIRAIVNINMLSEIQVIHQSFQIKKIRR